MIQPIFRTPKDHHYFFGYYDKSQLDRSSRKLLALEVSFIDRVPNKNDTALVGYFDIVNNPSEFVALGKTRTFNWQQGCMLQWLGPNHDRAVIYNDIINDKFSSVIIDIETGNKKSFPMPVYTVSKNGDFALCVDQERHHHCRRGYSYDGVVNDKKNKKIVPGDGVWRLDLKNGQLDKIIALDDLLNNNPLSNMQGAVHYVEHLMLNPSGTRFCFLHRWKMKDGGIFDRIYTADVNGENLYLLNDSGRTGHYCWRNDTELLAYAGLSNPVNKLRKRKNVVRFLFKPIMPLYHKIVKDSGSISKLLTGDSYVLFIDLSQYKKRVASQISSEDGHPSFSCNNDHQFITDTYPKRSNGSLAKLIMYNLKSNDFSIMAELKSIYKYDESPLRCDLHPKWSYDGDFVSVDTMDSGMRSIYLYKID